MQSAAPQKTLSWDKNWCSSLHLHACSQEVRGGVHLAAPSSGLGLELVSVHWDAARTLHPHAAAALDAPQAAEELGGQVHAAACPLLPTALPGDRVSARVLKRKGQKVVVEWRKHRGYNQTLPGLKLCRSFWMCLFADSCEEKSVEEIKISFTKNKQKCAHVFMYICSLQWCYVSSMVRGAISLWHPSD